MHRIRQVGERALLLSCRHSAAVAAAVRQSAAAQGLALREVVPAAETVLVELAAATDLSMLRALLQQLPDRGPVEATGTQERLVEVRFDGPDLASVAQRCGLDVAGVIDAIVGARLTAAFTGFTPGFAYLTGVAERLQLPRRDSPRTRVPAGTFAIAAGYAGIYPRETPGGWHLLGTTQQLMFDPRRDPAALISPGDTVVIAAVR